MFLTLFWLAAQADPAPLAPGPAVPEYEESEDWVDRPPEPPGGFEGGIVGGAVLSTGFTAVGAATRGAVWAGLGGCVACHTAPDGPLLAGGYAIETRFGTFFGSNLTMDPATGLGAWSIEDFARAVREGHRPGGGGYWPAFPYPSFRRLPNDVINDLWAWLHTVPPVERQEEEHQLGKYGPFDRWLWRSFVWAPRRDAPPPEDPVLARGQLLVDGLGHCGECHTPRTRYGRLDPERPLAGNPEPPEPAPSLVDPAGPGGWSAADWEAFLDLGMTPEGDYLGGDMGRIVGEGTSRLSREDRAAMIAWLRHLAQPE